jgi:hypothetical protein
MLLTIGLLEDGWMFLKATQITNAARAGCRAGVRAYADNGDVNSAISTLMNQAGMGGSGYSTNLSPSDCEILDVGDSFTVTITVNYSVIRLLSGSVPGLPVPATLRGVCTMAKEGPGGNA